jgi:serine protease Do
MSNNFGRQTLTLALVVGAVVFGIVLSAGTGIVPDSAAQVASGPVAAVHVDPQTGGLPSFADLAEAVSPAVVQIQTTTIDKEKGQGGRGGQGQVDPFEFFFGPRQQRPGQGFGLPEQRRQDASGSGFLVSPDGHIVTNHHVIEGATELQVQVGNRLYKATVKGDDPATDLALIKIEPEGRIPFLQLADSDKVRVGDWVVVIGSPLRLQNSVSVGVVSAKGRSINITAEPSLENFIQTDAAINFGNSGGPLVNLKGEVVGIATAMNFGASNIGFAVPANTLATILPQLRERGSVSRGYLGVNIDDLDFEEAQAWNLPDTEGALVTLVVKDGPGEKAGLERGDVLLQVDDRKIRFNRDLIDYVASQQPGKPVTLKVFRNGKTIEKKAILGERPRTGDAAVEAEAVAPSEESSVEWLGLSLQDVNKQMREAHGIPDELKGVWITSVEPDSPLFERNVRPNDLLVDLNGEPIEGTRDLQKKVAAVKAGGYLRFYVGRANPQTGEVVYFFAITRKP